ncbi:MAG: hypothetical protein IPM94_00630 [bacterium]|nr:hypothetical protein [bacterium]
MKTVGAMANRQIARDLQAAPATVDSQLARLGRHCLLFHAQRLAAAPLAGDLVIDGFESFEFSQYHPFHHHLAIEAGTSFVRYFTDSELRRKGRMTEYQKSRRRSSRGSVRLNPATFSKTCRNCWRSRCGTAPWRPSAATIIELTRMPCGRSRAASTT